MLSWLIATVLKFLGDNVLGKVLDYLEKKADNDTQRLKIQSIQEQHAMDVQANVVTTGMSHNWFWIPWLMATVPLAGWFGLGMLDTTFPGHLPHVATIPPGLLNWATIAWGNLFYSGGFVAGASLISGAIARR